MFKFKSTTPHTVSRFRFVHHFFFAIFVIAVPVYAQGSETTTKIVQFFNAGGRAEFGMRQALERLKQTDPKAAAEMTAAMANFNQPDLEKRLGILFDEVLSAEDIEIFVRFAKSPAGKAYGAAFQNSNETTGLAKRLGELRGTDRSGALEFQNSPTFTRMMNAMRSKKAMDISSQYGEDLVCGYYQSNALGALKAAKLQGKCSSIQE